MLDGDKGLDLLISLLFTSAFFILDKSKILFLKSKGFVSIDLFFGWFLITFGDIGYGHKYDLISLI